MNFAVGKRVRELLKDRLIKSLVRKGGLVHMEIDR